MSKSDDVTLVVHPERRLIGCVIIQALGGVEDRSIVSYFDNWLLAPAQGMAIQTRTRTEWRALALRWNSWHRRHGTPSAYDIREAIG